jgi:lysophospholipase L1-like esterase
MKRLIAAISTALVTSAAIAAPITIMPVGDSITVGYTDPPQWTIPYEDGYRYDLYNQLTTAGMQVQYIGGSQEPYNGIFGAPNNVPSPDLRAIGQDNMEGYGGQGTAFIAANIEGWLSKYQPDVILLDIGINGVNNPGGVVTTENGLQTIVQEVINTDPTAQLIVGQITPYFFGSNVANVQLNSWIANTLVPTYSADNVSTVDLYTPLTINGQPNQALTANGVNHPNAAGYALMADAWFNGIESVLPTKALTWNSPSGGSLSTEMNSGNSSNPQSSGQTASFTSAITAPSTVMLDAALSFATVNFESANSYTIAPGNGGSLTLDNGTGAAAVNDLAGSHTISAPIQLDSNTNITVDNPGDRLTLSGGVSGSVSLAVSGSGTVVISGASNSMTGLKISGGATVDLTTSLLTINYGAKPDPIGTIQGYLASGVLMSSSAAASGGKFALGYADGNVDLQSTAVPGQLLVEYALVGDTNLDGTVNLTDLLTLLNNYGQTSRDWAQGDFNYDGTVNLTDLLSLLNNYGQSATLASSSLFTSQVVPEPATCTLFALGLTTFLPRPRRQPPIPA